MSARPAKPPQAPPVQDVPPPPEHPSQVLGWAERYGVAERLDDVFTAGGYYQWYSPRDREDAQLTYRAILLDPGRQGVKLRSKFGPASDARVLLREMAKAVAVHRRDRAWMDAHGSDPVSPALSALLARLREEKEALAGGPAPAKTARPVGTTLSVRVRLANAPLPALCHEERTLTDPTGVGRRGELTTVALALLGWDEAPLRWTALHPGGHESTQVPPARRETALAAMIDFLRDPRQVELHHELEEALLIPAWRFAMGDLDRRLAELGADAHASGPVAEGRSSAPTTRVGFRLRADPSGGKLNIEPVVQKRQRSGIYSKGSRVDWHKLPLRDDLTELDRNVYRAFADQFDRSAAWGMAWGRRRYGVLCALIDHPAVFLEGQGREERPDIRRGRLGLRFVNAGDGGLVAQFELLGHVFAAPDIVESIEGGSTIVHLLRPERGRAQILLSALSPAAVAMVQALAVAPGRFPVEAHDALAVRLESLQGTMDIEFPSQWTRTITAGDHRPLVRLELLASGALSVRVVVRPVERGPVFPPGEGPTLVLEGQGQDRHGVRRDPEAERAAAAALIERLQLSLATEVEPGCWRVDEGDPSLHVVATLKELGQAVFVEWADEERLLSLGSVSRGSMRMQVADKRDWFGVSGGAEVEVDGERQIVPLAALFAAIRDGRRFVPVGNRGFVRIEDKLREALVQAEAGIFEHRGSLQVSAVASESLMSLVEQQAQVEACAAFLRVRERMREGETVTPRLTPAMAATLRPYQQAGVTWMTRMAHWDAGVILADEMGLGKTVQTLAVLSHRAALGPALVVAPTSVTPNWLAEASRFAPELRAVSLRGADRAALAAGTWKPRAGEVLVSSYAIATLEAEALAKLNFATLVVDEAQSVKNATTERAKALRDLRADWRVGLTGTPIENRLGELWSILRVLSPGLLGSWEQFRARYAVPIEKFGDEERRQALAALLRPFILRRTKGEVAPELPARTELVRHVRLSPEEHALYEELRVATLAEIADRKKGPERDGQEIRFVLLAALTRLRQLCCHPRLVYPHATAGSSKTATLLQLLEDLRGEQHRVLVFSQFRSFLELLAPRLRQQGHRVLVLDGTTPSDVREQRVAAFQAGAADVFLISLKAGGFGLNLTAADTVVHLDPWWNPAVEDQATARAHRIGQSKPVTAIRLVASGTIEESVLGLHAAKRALASGILDGSELAASLNTEQLVELIQSGFEPVPPRADAGGRPARGARGREGGILPP